MSGNLENLLNDYEDRIEKCCLELFKYERGFNVDPKDLESVLVNVRELKEDYFDEFKDYSSLLRLARDGSLSARMKKFFYRLQGPRKGEGDWSKNHVIANNYLVIVDLEKDILEDLKKATGKFY